jgi:hypothetical protein
MAKLKVVVIGASGFLAGRVLPTFRDRYDLVLLDVKTTDREGNEVAGVDVANLIDLDRDSYRSHFSGAEVVVHCGAARGTYPESVETSSTPPPPDIRFQGRALVRGDASFLQQMDNIRMAYNVYQTCIEEDVGRVVMLSSNHGADFYEHAIWRGEMDVISPDMPAYSDNYYGWAKGAYESLGLAFAAGELTGQKSLEVIQLRIGGPRENDADSFTVDDPTVMHRQLGGYLSQRDQIQQMVKSVEAEDVTNDHGVPFQIFYGVSNNTHRFWDLSNARRVIGYAPEDDSSVKFGNKVADVLKEARQKQYPDES